MIEQDLFQSQNGGSIPTSPLQLYVREVTDKATMKNFLKKWHYLGEQDFIFSIAYGAYYEYNLVGIIIFHPPSAIETVKGLFGHTDQRGIFEIGRLAMTDACPKNSESRFIAIAIKLMRKKIDVKAIITYADSGVGHKGIIYKASGFKYLGLTAPKNDFWVDGKIQQRGKTKGIKGEWRPRSRKHMYIKEFNNMAGRQIEPQDSF